MKQRIFYGFIRKIGVVDPNEGLMSSKKLIIIAVVVALLVVGSVWLWQQIQIDRCLDNGGRWNYENGKCEASVARME